MSAPVERDRARGAMAGAAGPARCATAYVNVVHAARRGRQHGLPTPSGRVVATAPRAPSASTVAARAGDVHFQWAPVQRSAIERTDSALRLFARFILDERETPRASRRPIEHEGCRNQRSMRCESVAQLLLSSREIEVANVQLRGHLRTFWWRPGGLRECARRLLTSVVPATRGNNRITASTRAARTRRVARLRTGDSSGSTATGSGLEKCGAAKQRRRADHVRLRSDPPPRRVRPARRSRGPSVAPAAAANASARTRAGSTTPVRSRSADHESSESSLAVSLFATIRRPTSRCGGPEHVFRCLSRYTRRIAISNCRLLSITDQAVRFRTHHGRSATLHLLLPRAALIQHGDITSPNRRHVVSLRAPPADADRAPGMCG